jgi:hypothetical protein
MLLLRVMAVPPRNPSMPPTPPRELRFGTKSAAELYTTIRTMVRTVGMVVIFYFFFHCIEQFAGTSTQMDVSVSFLVRAVAELKFAIAITLAGAACAWAAVERRLRKRAIVNMGGRIVELETIIDPERSSSGLTQWGGTHPRDRLR